MLSSSKMRELFTDLIMDNYNTSLKILVEQKPPFGKINHKPDYQRSYVWNTIKATSFIESLLMRTEIPPLIFWCDEDNELIDGRQRYETLLKFINNKFSLNERGLYILKALANKKYEDLPDIHNYFMETKVRVLTIMLDNFSKWDENQVDQIKKAIFRRYNTGITPLRAVELARAKYVQNNLTQYFINRFKEDNIIFKKTSLLLSNIKNKDFYDLVEIIMTKIRILLVIDKIKIDYLISSGGKKIAEILFSAIKNSKENNKKIYKNFAKKIEILSIIKSYFDSRSLRHYTALYETLYWSLSILEKEKISIEECKKAEFCNSLYRFILAKQSLIFIDKADQADKSKINKIRFYYIAKFLEQYFKLNLDRHLKITDDFINKIQKLRKTNKTNNNLEEIKQYQLNCFAIKPKPVYEILNDIQNEKMLLRPPYQRNENPDLNKASCLIESILLNFKLMPIFAYIRKDGVIEIIDGQQRLLTILGFMGEKYKNQDGVFTESLKNKFKLQNLTVLKELNGKEYKCSNDNDCISKKERNMILNTSIPFIEIYEDQHKDFKPIDLFIRLNSKPYPIKNHSFEIWNTILPNTMLEFIKDNTNKHKNWFFIKENDLRMRNEELYTIIMFLETRKSKETHINDKDIKHYGNNNKPIIKIYRKSDISDFLYDIASKNEFEKIKNNTEDFIAKLKLLLNNDIENSDTITKNNLDALITNNSKRKQRPLKMILALWYFLSPINSSVIKTKNLELKNDLKELLSYFLSNDKTYTNFKNKLQIFRNKYSPIEIDKEIVNNNNKKQKSNTATKAKKIKLLKTNLNPNINDTVKSSTINFAINIQSDSAKATIMQTDK